MQTRFTTQPFNKVEADALAIVLFDGEAAPAELQFASASIDELKPSAEFSSKSDEIAVLHQSKDIAAKRLVVVGGGKRDSFNARKAASLVARSLKSKGVKKLAWWLNGGAADAI